MLTQHMSETLSIVGAGRVGRALGRRLRELGWRVGVVVTRLIPTARTAVRLIGAGHPSDRLTRQVLASDVVLMATPDNAIESVAEELAHLGGNEWGGKVVLHASGALDASALRALADAGAETGSIHPMQTFSSQSVPDLAGRVFGIEGSPAALKVARKMIRQMGGVAVRLSGANKAAYHAAGTFACAHVLALLETARVAEVRVAVLIRLVAATGMRRGEACAVRWNDLDTKAGTVMIDQGVVSTPDGTEARRPKTRSSIRRVALDTVTLSPGHVQAESKCNGVQPPSDTDLYVIGDCNGITSISSSGNVVLVRQFSGQCGALIHFCNGPRDDGHSRFTFELAMPMPVTTHASATPCASVGLSLRKTMP